MTIETKRLVLRPFEDNDAESLYLIAKNPNIGPRCGWNAHKDVAESKFVIENVLKNDYTFAITKNNELVGAISKMPFEYANFDIGLEDVELGFWIAEEHWGKGIIVEALNEIIKYCCDLGVKNIYCGHMSDNLQSKKVQEKLGFKYAYTVENRYYPLINEYKDTIVNKIINNGGQ